MTALAALLVAATAVMTCAAVFFRFVLESSLGWPEEVGGLLLVWISFVGAYIATRDHSHISFRLVVDSLPAPLRRVTDGLCDLLLAAFFCVLLYQSVVMIRAVGSTQIETLDVERGYFMAVLPLCAASLALAYATDLLRRSRGR